MWKDILFLLLGLALLVFGGNAVTDGSVAIAKRMKLSGLIIGLTVVAFGSSVPDLCVCVMSTVQDKSQLAIGDIVGAGIFDLLCAVGLTALVRPLIITEMSLKADIPLLMLAAFVLFVMGDDIFIDGFSKNMLDRSDGLVFLCFFAIYVAFTITYAKSQEKKDPPKVAQSCPIKPEKTVLPMKHNVLSHSRKPNNMWMAAIYIIIGLGALVIGGNWIVDGASGLALKAGLSEALVGLTIVAIGSSLPDAATSVIAAIKGEQGIAMGNLVGACIFDILFVLGTCSLIKPLNCGQITMFDYLTLLGAALLVYLFAKCNKSHIINRLMGAILVALYIGYIFYLCFSLK